MAPDRIITALLVQRCLEPQSKLHAVRWFPRTILPELLQVSPAQFNNTRVHRVLEQLEPVERELMRALSRRAYEQQGRFATLFLDLTDTWFEGEGPELAKRGKTKEGLVRKKIGIVLLCNEQGQRLGTSKGIRILNAAAAGEVDMTFEVRLCADLRARGR